MNYIYYNTGEESKRNWHGSPSYYEYPNVFLDVLVHDFLGLRPDEAADLLVAPCCTGDTQVSGELWRGLSAIWARLFNPEYFWRIQKVRVDLSKIFAGWKDCHGASSAVYTLLPNQSLQFLKAFHSGKGTVEMKNSLSLLARQSAGPVFFESIAS